MSRFDSSPWWLGDHGWITAHIPSFIYLHLRYLLVAKWNIHQIALSIYQFHQVSIPCTSKSMDLSGLSCFDQRNIQSHATQQLLLNNHMLNNNYLLITVLYESCMLHVQVQGCLKNGWMKVMVGCGTSHTRCHLPIHNAHVGMRGWRQQRQKEKPCRQGLYRFCLSALIHMLKEECLLCLVWFIPPFPSCAPLTWGLVHAITLLSPPSPPPPPLPLTSPLQ